MTLNVIILEEYITLNHKEVTTVHLVRPLMLCIRRYFPGVDLTLTEHSLQDPDGNPTRSILGRTDDVALTKSPSETRPPDVNTGSNTSRQYQKRLSALNST